MPKPRHIIFDRAGMGHARLTCEKPDCPHWRDHSTLLRHPYLDGDQPRWDAMVDEYLKIHGVTREEITHSDGTPIQHPHNIV